MESRVIFIGVLTHSFMALADCICYKDRDTDERYMAGLWSS
jgi:hypothetical protein